MQFSLGLDYACSHQVFQIWPVSLAVLHCSDGMVSWFSSPFWCDAKIVVNSENYVICCCIRLHMITFKSDQSATLLMALSWQKYCTETFLDHHSLLLLLNQWSLWRHLSLEVELLCKFILLKLNAMPRSHYLLIIRVIVHSIKCLKILHSHPILEVELLASA